MILNIFSIKRFFGAISLLVVIFVIFPMIFWSQRVQNRLMQKSHKLLVDEALIFQLNNSGSYLDVWRRWQDGSQTLPKHLGMFKVVISEKDLNVTLDMLDAFSSVMDEHNLTYFMDGGTLLGSYRHHGLIPWDDDLDVLADYDQQKQVREVLETMKDEYVVSNHSKGLLKLHAKSYSRFISKSYAWKWPFLDIFWFHRNESHLHIPWGSRTYNVTNVFPLKNRPFANLLLKSPNDIAPYLNKLYDDWTDCARPWWNHRAETRTGLEWRQVKCTDLTKYYPMVERRHLNNESSLEYLQHNVFYLDRHHRTAFSMITNSNSCTGYDIHTGAKYAGKQFVGTIRLTPVYKQNSVLEIIELRFNEWT